MYREALKPSAPPSPPATLPASISSLPHSEYDSPLFSPLDDFLHIHNLGDDSDPESPLLDAVTPSSESTCSSILSPLSPTSSEPLEWQDHCFSSPGILSSGSSSDSVLLHNNGIDNTSISPIDYDQGSLYDRQLDTQQPTTSKRPLLSPLNIPNHCEYFWHLCHSPKDPHEPSDLEPLDIAPTTFTSSPYPHSPEVESPERAQARTLFGDDHDINQVQQDSHHDSLPQTLTYRQGTFPHPSSPSIRSNSLPEFDDDLNLLDIYLPEVPPASPALRSYAALPDDEDADSQRSYPSMDQDTDFDNPMLSPPSSPGPSLLSLPGVETDDDLLPTDVALTKPLNLNRNFSIHSPESTRYPNPLLIIGDDSPSHPNQNQRSPSPEPFATLDMSLVMNEFPEDDDLRRICGLLKRTRDAERAARQMEAMVEEEERINGGISGGHGGTGTLDAWNRLTDVRRKTKRRREKVREVATLLRLQLAQRGWKVGKDASGKMGLIPITPPASSFVPLEESGNEDGMKVDLHQKTKGLLRTQHITSPQQLLVKMIMDRHEPRHSSRVAASGSVAKKAASPLARKSVSAGEAESVADDMDVFIQEDVPRPITEVELHDGGLGGGDQDMDDLDMDLQPL